MKKNFLRFLGIIFSLLIAIILGEIATRGYLHFIYGPRLTLLDTHLGWRASPNYLFQGIKIDSEGEKYYAVITTNYLGFRHFGDIKSSRPKVFIIGDSYTHAMDISDDKTYYHHLTEILDAEIFAYGAGGYGTLQELMIIEKYFGMIDPDIIILQYCSNDFINNHFLLEKLSYGNSNGKLRPYLTLQGDKFYALPASLSQFRNIINHHSMFLYFIVYRIDKLLAKFKTYDSIEYVIKKNPSLPLFRESVTITSRLLEKIQNKVPDDVEIFTFGSDNMDPFYSEFKEISLRNGINFIDGIPQAVLKVEESGISVRFDGSHWNIKGHEIVAHELGKYLKAELSHKRNINPSQLN